MGPENTGFAVHDNVIPASEIRALSATVEALALPYSRAGARHVLAHEPIGSLARDTRLLKIAADWLGGAAIAFKATFFNKDGQANWLVAWHQDTALPLTERSPLPGWGPWSTKDGITYAHAPADVLARVIALRVHLDDSTQDNGPLRVLPGTHELGVLSGAQVHELAQKITPRECCAPAGAVVALRPLLIHASSKSRVPEPRRVLHFEYASSLDIGPGLRLRAA